MLGPEEREAIQQGVEDLAVALFLVGCVAALAWGLVALLGTGSPDAMP
jgi:hypothetical protein